MNNFILIQIIFCIFTLRKSRKIRIFECFLKSFRLPFFFRWTFLVKGDDLHCTCTASPNSWNQDFSWLLNTCHREQTGNIVDHVFSHGTLICVMDPPTVFLLSFSSLCSHAGFMTESTPRHWLLLLSYPCFGTVPLCYHHHIHSEIYITNYRK